MGTDEEEIASPSLSVVESRAGFQHTLFKIRVHSRPFAVSFFLHGDGLDHLKSSNHRPIRVDLCHPWFPSS